MKRAWSVSGGLLLAAAMVLAGMGCGQKGPLVLPAKAAASAPASSAPNARP